MPGVQHEAGVGAVRVADEGPGGGEVGDAGPGQELDTEALSVSGGDVAGDGEAGGGLCGVNGGGHRDREHRVRAKLLGDAADASGLLDDGVALGGPFRPGGDVLEHRQLHARAVEDGSHLRVGETLGAGFVVVGHPHGDAREAILAGGADAFREGRRADCAEAENQVVRNEHRRSPR